jgi:hypothetical protein
MTRAITQDDFLANASQRLASLGNDVFVIEQDGQFVAALVSQKDFEALRRVHGQRAIAAMNRLSDAIEASGATHEELLELEKALDRKA